MVEPSNFTLIFWLVRHIVNRIIWFRKDLRRFLVQPHAQSRVSDGVWPGYAGLCQDRSWKSLTMETAQPLWAHCSTAWLSSWWERLSLYQALLVHVELVCQDPQHCSPAGQAPVCITVKGFSLPDAGHYNFIGLLLACSFSLLRSLIVALLLS